MHNHQGRPNRTAPDAPTGPRHPVLHIRSDSTAGIALSAPDGPSMDARLTIAGLDADTCDDVYRGLARLCKGDDVPTRMVVVSVDELAPAEFEFFTILSRIRRNVSIYVYSRNKSDARTTRAIEHGAIGEATDEVLRMLGAAMRAAGVTERAPNRCVDQPSENAPREREAVKTDRSSPAQDGADVAPVAPAPDPPSTHGDDATPEPPEPMAPGDGRPDVDTAEPARVPWLRYADEPVRRAPPPRRSAPSPPSEAPAPLPIGRTVPAESALEPDSFEPLLTDEELEALMGDDIAAIAPDESSALRGDDEKDSTARGES